MKLFGIGCRRVSSRGFRDQSGKGGEEDVLTTCKVIDTCMLVSGIFKQLTTFVVIPDVFSTSDDVYDASISRNYIERDA